MAKERQSRDSQINPGHTWLEETFLSDAYKFVIKGRCFKIN